MTVALPIPLSPTSHPSDAPSPQHPPAPLCIIKDARAALDKPALLCNADDTLWDTSALFSQAHTAITDLLTASGFDPIQWDLFCVTQQDDQTIKRAPEIGSSSQQYARTAVRAYEQLTRAKGCALDPEIISAIHQVAHRISTEPVSLFPDVISILEELTRSYRLILFTTGDIREQHERIDRSGVARLFDGIAICHQKDVETFTAVCMHFGIDPDRSWAVGNTMNTDITPAEALGMRGVLLTGEVHATSTSTPSPHQTRTAASFAQIPALLTLTNRQ